MSENGDNGEIPIIDPSKPPDEAPGDLVIKIRLRPSAHGLDLAVEHPPTLYRDTVVDACLRVARWYGRLQMLEEMAAAQKHAIEMARMLGRIR